MSSLDQVRVAILATDGVEQVELTGPQKALVDAGATVTVVAPKGPTIQGMDHDDKGEQLKVDAVLSTVTPEQFDALLLPGGVASPDKLRVERTVIDFVRHFVSTGKPIAAICHGPWTLIEVGAVRGKRMTSWPSLRTDLSNAGATWVDEAVVRDGALVTSRKPDDIAEFCRSFIELIGESTAKKAA